MQKRNVSPGHTPLFVYLYRISLLYYFLKIRGRMFAQRTDIISGQFLSLVNITADRTAPHRLSGLGRLRRLRFNG